MTQLLYLTDSYIRTFDAVISSLDIANHGVILDQTTFYPGGGGQPPDSGTLSIGDTNYTVKRVQKLGSNIVHIIAGDVPLPEINAPVKGEIDWENRYQLMRTHTAMHILCGVIFRDYGSSVTGGGDGST